MDTIVGFGKDDSLRFHNLLAESLKNQTFLEGKTERTIKKNLAAKYSNVEKMDLYGKHMQLV